MFHDWDNFYLLIGSAAGALIGLVFVVATLTAGIDPERASRGAKIYITPIIFHLTVVMVVSVISAVPKLPIPAVGVLLVLGAVIGLGYSILTTVRIMHLDWQETPHWSDKHFYGILPTIAYLGLAAGAVEVWLAPTCASYVIAVVMLLLLLLGVRNAWDLATTIVQMKGKSGE